MRHCGPGRQQRPDGAPRVARRAILQGFADGVEQHDAHGLGQLADGRSRDGCAAHQGVFVEKVELEQALQALLEDGQAAEQVGDAALW